MFWFKNIIFLLIAIVCLSIIAYSLGLHKEDNYNIYDLKGYKLIQSWDALVYHFTSRGSRFNKHSGGAAGKNSEEWLHTTNKNMRNFIRKWGTPVLHDPLMKPIIPSTSGIAIQRYWRRKGLPRHPCT